MGDMVIQSLGALGMMVIIGIIFIIVGILGEIPIANYLIPTNVRFILAFFGDFLSVLGFYLLIQFSYMKKNDREQFRNKWVSIFVGIGLIIFIISSILIYFENDAQISQSSAIMQTETPNIISIPVDSTQQQIKSTILIYFNNIQNDRIHTSELDLSKSWNVLYKDLQETFGGEIKWAEYVDDCLHIINTDFIDSIEYADYYGKADLDIEVIHPTASWSSEEATVCLWRVGGKWFITHIYQEKHELDFCKEN